MIKTNTGAVNTGGGEVTTFGPGTLVVGTPYVFQASVAMITLVTQWCSNGPCPFSTKVWTLGSDLGIVCDTGHWATFARNLMEMKEMGWATRKAEVLGEALPVDNRTRVGFDHGDRGFRSREPGHCFPSC